MEYIISHLTENLAKKLLANKENALEYLRKLNVINPTEELENIKKSIPTSSIWKLVVKYWNYNIGKDIIRTIFLESPKYKRGKVIY